MAPRKLKLGFWPPALAEGPLSILDLPVDDWAMEPKADGIRVIIKDGEAFTRHDAVLSAPKGAAQLKRIVKEACVNRSLDYHGIVIEGEWVPKIGVLWVFDLPEHGGIYDERHQAIVDMFGDDGPPVLPIQQVRMDFRSYYDMWKSNPNIEGVVMKRRNSLYKKQAKAGAQIRDWLKRRFSYDK